MKRKLILLIVLLAAMRGNAQKSELLIGKWQFKDFYNSGVTDTLRVAQARKFYQKMEMVFKSDQHYTFNLLRLEEGVWQYNQDLKTLSMTNTNSTHDKFDVVELTDKSLILIFQDKKGFIFEKIIEPKN